MSYKGFLIDLLSPDAIRCNGGEPNRTFSLSLPRRPVLLGSGAVGIGFERARLQPCRKHRIFIAAFSR